MSYSYKIENESSFKKVSDCYLTPDELFSTLWRQNKSNEDDEVRFVLDQHAELNFYSANSLKQESMVDLSLH